MTFVRLRRDRQIKTYPSVGESLRDSQLSAWETQYCLGKRLPAGRLIELKITCRFEGVSVVYDLGFPFF